MMRVIYTERMPLTALILTGAVLIALSGCTVTSGGPVNPYAPPVTDPPHSGGSSFDLSHCERVSDARRDERAGSDRQTITSFIGAEVAIGAALGIIHDGPAGNRNSDRGKPSLAGPLLEQYCR